MRFRGSRLEIHVEFHLNRQQSRFSIKLAKQQFSMILDKYLRVLNCKTKKQAHVLIDQWFPSQKLSMNKNHAPYLKSFEHNRKDLDFFLFRNHIFPCICETC